MPLHEVSRPEPQPYYPGYEINYTQITSGVNVTSTTEATPTTVISPGAITFDGAPVIAEFYAVIVSPLGATSVLTVVLFESTTEIARLAELEQFGAGGSQQFVGTLYGRYRFTPSAGSHTYTVGAFVNSTAGTPAVGAGTGGAGNPPAFIRFTKV